MSEEQPAAFGGFPIPTKNFFHLPNNMTDIIARIDNLSELKIVLYLARHTWGFQEYGIYKAISVDEFVCGRKQKKMGPDGKDIMVRMDEGTGLSEPSVKDGLKRGIKHGYVLCKVDDKDQGRVKKYYTLRMMASEEEGGKNLTGQESYPVSNLPSEVKNLTPRGKESYPRTEKETKESNSRKTKRENAHVSDDTHATPSSSQSHPLSDFVIYDNFADPHVVTILLSNDPEVNKYRRRCYEDMRHAFVLQEREITFKFVQEVESDVITGTVVDASNSPSSLQETPTEESAPAPSDEQESKQAVSHSQSAPHTTAQDSAKQAPSEQEKPASSGKGNKGSQGKSGNGSKTIELTPEQAERRRTWQERINDNRGGPLRKRGLCINETTCLAELVSEFSDEQIEFIFTYATKTHWKFKANPHEVGGKDLLDMSRPVVKLMKEPAQQEQKGNNQRKSSNTVSQTTQTAAAMAEAEQSNKANLEKLRARKAAMQAKAKGA